MKPEKTVELDDPILDKSLINKAKKFNTLGEWVKSDRESYLLATKRKLFAECTEHMTSIVMPAIWTYERCENNAIKFGSIKDWKIACPDSYGKASSKGWLPSIRRAMEQVVNSKPKEKQYA